MSNFKDWKLPKLLKRFSLTPLNLPVLAEWLAADEILDEMPDLEREDLQASLAYAAHKFDHPVLVAT